jgi:hypothetical protein
VFILYAVVIGVLIGFAVGGRLEGLAKLRFRWAPVAIGGLVVQLLVFGPLGSVVGAAGPALYIGSTLAVLAAVVRNVSIPGLVVVAVGAVSNLAAIVANGGVMPADPGAAALAGLSTGTGEFSNSAVTTAPVLRPLTDIFAVPAGIPLANVFSVGDVLIGIGVAVAIVAGMRLARRSIVGRPRATYE